MSIHYKKKTPLAQEELGPRPVAGKGTNTQDPDLAPFLSSCSKKKRTLPGSSSTPLVITDDDGDVSDLREPKKPHLGYRSNYSSIIIEAISTMDKPNGSNFNDIVQFIEQRYQVPQNFKSLLSDTLGGLVPQRKLDEVRNYFKIKDKSVETSPPQLLEGKGGRAFPASCCTSEPEDMESFAAKAVKEYEGITQIFKDTGSTMEVLKYIHENCMIIQALNS